MDSAAKTVPEVDRILSRMTDWLERTASVENPKLALSRQDVKWLCGEIEGGNEAFEVLVQQKADLQEEVGRMRRTIDTLMAMRRKPNG